MILDTATFARVSNNHEDRRETFCVSFFLFWPSKAGRNCVKTREMTLFITVDNVSRESCDEVT